MGQPGAIHLAAQKGLFAKHGLDVTLDDGNGSVATVQIVGNGEYDVGHASLAPMAIARSKGLPVKAIAGFIQQNDIGLLVPKESGIKSPADLKGKKIAFTAGSLETPFIDRFLAAGKLTRNDVELLNVDAAAKAGTYMAGRTDGAFSSVPFFLAVVATQRPSNSVNFADYGLQFPSFGLFATEKTIADQARRACDVSSASSPAAWTYIFDGHEDEAAQAIIAARPQSKLDPRSLRQQIDPLKDFAFTEATEDPAVRNHGGVGLEGRGRRFWPMAGWSARQSNPTRLHQRIHRCPHRRRDRRQAAERTPTIADDRRLQTSVKRFGGAARRHRARRRFARHRGGRIRQPARAERLRQEHVSALPCRPREADQRHAHDRRRADRRAAGPARHGVPARRAAGLVRRAGERPAAGGFRAATASAITSRARASC